MPEQLPASCVVVPREVAATGDPGHATSPHRPWDSPPPCCHLQEASRLPPNQAIEAIPDAIAAAAKAHGAPQGVVVMVVQPGERNAYDQQARAAAHTPPRATSCGPWVAPPDAPSPSPSLPPPPQWIQLQLWERHGVRTLRRTMAQLAAVGQLDAQGTLSVPLSMAGPDALAAEPGSPRVPVSVAYFRAGYVPGDYPTEAEWAARRLVETSNAAKCPTVAYQLAGEGIPWRRLAPTPRLPLPPCECSTLRPRLTHACTHPRM